MFTTQKNFLPKQHPMLAHRSCAAAMRETSVLSVPRRASDGNFDSVDNGLLSEAVGILGLDGAAEFTAAGFRLHEAGRR